MEASDTWMISYCNSKSSVVLPCRCCYCLHHWCAFSAAYVNSQSETNRRTIQSLSTDWPAFPADFVYGTYPSPPKGKLCIRTYERFQFSRWNDKLLCIRGGTRDLGLRWSDKRAIPGMSCVKVDEPREYRRGTWDDNHLCLPNDSPFE